MFDFFRRRRNAKAPQKASSPAPGAGGVSASPPSRDVRRPSTDDDTTPGINAAVLIQAATSSHTTPSGGQPSHCDSGSGSSHSDSSGGCSSDSSSF